MHSKRLLILSDGKPGHLNQSIAFARHLGLPYDVVPVSFKHRLLKIASYLLDRCGVYPLGLCLLELEHQNYDAIVSAGSNTYFANKALAKRIGCKSIAIMFPRGYRLTFDLIIAQQHDDPPEKGNILQVPINLAFIEPQGHLVPEAESRYIALIIGGDSAHQKLDVGSLRRQIEQVVALFPRHLFWITTSRRTSAEVEAMLQTFEFNKTFYYGQSNLNPVPDFLQHCERVFVTADSSSMVSEVVSYGDACVEVLPLMDPLPKRHKLNRLIAGLINMKAVHLFDGSCSNCRFKISLAEIFKTNKVEQRFL